MSPSERHAAITRRIVQDDFKAVLENGDWKDVMVLAESITLAACVFAGKHGRNPEEALDRLSGGVRTRIWQVTKGEKP